MKKQGHKVNGNDGNRRSQTAATPPCGGATGGISKGRRALLAVLKEFGVSVQGFDGLRADSYEKHIARRSLTALARVYEGLLGAFRGYEKIQVKMPRWGKGHRLAGKLPHFTTLCEIKQRIMAEEALNDLSKQLAFLEQVKARLTGLPAGQQASVVDAAMALITQELLSAKLEGKPLLSNLAGVDRLLRAQTGQVRERHGKQRLELRQQSIGIQQQRADLAREKFVYLKDLAVGHKKPKVESVGLTGERIEEVLEKLYGKNPAKLQAADNKTVQPVEVLNHKGTENTEDLAVGQQAPDSNIQAPEKPKAKGINAEDLAVGHQRARRDAEKKAPEPKILNHKGTENTEDLAVGQKGPDSNEGEQQSKANANWGLERTLQSATQNRQVGKPAPQPKAVRPTTKSSDADKTANTKTAKVVEPEKGWWMWRGMNKTWVPGEKPDNYDENGLEIQSHLIRKSGDQSDSPAPSLTIQQQAYLQYQVLLGNHQHAAGPHL